MAWRIFEQDIIMTGLVTGGMGFIVSNFVINWLSNNDGNLVNPDENPLTKNQIMQLLDYISSMSMLLFYAKQLKHSQRCELEITDLNKIYLNEES